MKNVLVVAYYFPPMGLSGVQRITKFVKYLPEFGWKPTVLTVDPGGYFAFDPGLEADIQGKDIRVERTRTLDPTRLFKKKSTVALPSESSRKWLSRISQALFIPDNKVGWVRPAVQRGLQLHREIKFDAILATIPPYSSALVARAISDKTNIPYILDYRDDWLDNPRHEYLTPLHRLVHRMLEKKVLSKASTIVSINDRIAHRIKSRISTYFGDSSLRTIEIISQGFDQQDLAGKQSITKDGILKLVYSGVFYDAQTPDFFIKALHQFIIKDPKYRSNVRAVFVGLVPEESKELVRKLNLDDIVSYTGYVSHKESIDYLFKADALWMTVGNGKGQELISTSKLYEYMGTCRPILGLVPEGAAREALEAYGASWIVLPDSISEIVGALELMYKQWTEDEYPDVNINFVKTLERKQLTRKLSELLNSVT